MSLIQKLRSKTGLITIFIGTALFAFIITDLDPQMFSAITGNNNVIARVNGERYEYNEYYDIFERLRQQLPPEASDVQQQAVYNQAWESFIAEIVYDDVYKRTGLGMFNPWLNIIGISKSEFEDIMIGKNIAPEVYTAEIFRNPETNSFDRDILMQTLANLPFIREEYPEFYKEWLSFETGMHQKVLEDKLSAIVGKALHPTHLEINQAFKESKYTSSIDFVRIDYSTVSDSLISVTDADIREYYRKHTNAPRFQQKESVSFEYVSFPIEPTSDDVKRTRELVVSLQDGFVNARNLRSFLNVNSDKKFDPTYYKQGELPQAIDEFAFSAAINDITDVLFENNTYKIAKVSDIRDVADSARVRHILATGPDAMERIDSLKAVLENNQASFTDLVRKYSADSASIPNGGVYDWFTEGQMVKPFQDSSFFGQVGSYYVVPTQFGVHLLEILDQGPKSKRVQVQYLAREVQYSTETRRNVYSNAIMFASENVTQKDFDKTIAESPDLIKRVASQVPASQRSLPGIRDSREVIRWAHKNKGKVGLVSDIFSCGDAFVIAVVTASHAEGAKPLAQVEDEVRALVVLEKKKEYIERTIAENQLQTLSAVAQNFNTRVQQASDIKFVSPTVTGIGREPKVIATASILEPGIVSQPIKGENAVYALVVNQRNIDESVTVDAIRIREVSNRRFFPNSIYPYLKEKANVQDNRIKFF